MELTVLKKPEEIILALAKRDLFSEDLKIEENTFTFRLFHFSITGKFKMQIQGNSASFLFLTKFGGAKADFVIYSVDEITTRIKLNVSSWGFLGRFLKSKIEESFINFVIDLDFKKPVSVSKKLLVKMYTNHLGLQELLSKLTLDSDYYYFLIINKEKVVEIVNGIPLYGEDIKNYCKDLCYIELYMLKPNTI